MFSSVFYTRNFFVVHVHKNIFFFPNCTLLKCTNLCTVHTFNGIERYPSTIPEHMYLVYFAASKDFAWWRWISTFLRIETTRQENKNVVDVVCRTLILCAVLIVYFLTGSKPDIMPSNWILNILSNLKCMKRWNINKSS